MSRVDALQYHHVMFSSQLIALRLIGALHILFEKLQLLIICGLVNWWWIGRAILQATAVSRSSSRRGLLSQP
jgi:hypothetical protein